MATMINYFKVCPFCERTSNIKINLEDYRKYLKGEFILNAFPYLSAQEREIIINGTCAQCQEKMYN